MTERNNYGSKKLDTTEMARLPAGSITLYDVEEEGGLINNFKVLLLFPHIFEFLAT